MIDEVVRFCPELKALSLGNGDFLEESKIPILEARLVDGVTDTGLKIEGS